MLSVKNHQRKRRIWFAFLLLIIGVSVSVAVFSYLETGSPFSLDFIQSKINSSSTEVKPDPQPTEISSNVLFLGNIFWGRYINDWSMASPLQYEYPFSRLNEFNRDQYDAWISGLECPTVASVNTTSAEQAQALQFNCSPNYLPEAAKWFTVVTLANNHTDNQGVEGFEETRQQLETNGIQYFGHYDPTVLEDVCEVISLPVTVTKDDESKIKGNLPVALCGYHGIFQIPPIGSVDEISKYSEYMPVIAMPHMGAEYVTGPDQIKTDFYRSLIDAGADMVIGDHPHVTQTSESYEGHLIIYSMGNFIFDQQVDADVTNSAAINLFMATSDSDSESIKSWLALGETCKTFKDDCLAQAKEQNLAKLNITYQFSIIAANDNDKIAKPATDEQRAYVMGRLDWQTTIDNLQAPYSGL